MCKTDAERGGATVYITTTFLISTTCHVNEWLFARSTVYLLWLTRISKVVYTSTVSQLKVGVQATIMEACSGKHLVYSYIMSVNYHKN